MSRPDACAPGPASARPGAARPHHRLSVEKLSKTFGSARVLRDVGLVIAPGEMHGLVGQNGCGKSTFIKILTGVYTPDHGAALAVDGRRLATPVRPGDARAAGVGVVHQNLGLVNDRTVWENVRIGRYAAGRFTRRIDTRAERAAVAEVFDRLGRRIDVEARTGTLSAEDRAAVAIARAMQNHREGGGLIIFDESTRALGRRARANFHELIKGLIEGGTSVLLVSHQLEEIVEYTNRVTVLRDGEVVETGVLTRGTDEAGLTRLMLGRHLAAAARVPSHATDRAAAVARGVAVGPVADLDLTVKRGEIVGLTGLVGSGWLEVAEALGGARRAAAGSLAVDGAALDLAAKRGSSAQFIKAGVAYVPESRNEAGVAGEMTVAQNITVPRLREHGGRAWTGGGWQRAEAAAMITRLDIRPPDPDAPVATLSGGNAQKVLLGKWLAGKPKLLVLLEPTQAVDVGARSDIIDALRQAAAEGCGVLVATIDAADLAALCDRVLVFRDGAVEQLAGDQLEQDTIVHATFGQNFADGNTANRKTVNGNEVAR